MLGPNKLENNTAIIAWVLYIDDVNMEGRCCANEWNVPRGR